MKNKFGLLISLVVCAVLCACSSNQRPTSVYLIPEGYEGWVQIAFGQKSEPEIPVEDSKEIFTLNEDGKLMTSTPEPSYGAASDEFYYVDGEGKRTEIDPNQRIHFQTIGSKNTESGESRSGGTVVIDFFVGDKDRVDEYPKPPIP
ncbi:hypothetical protein CDO73_00610 [Saccharibacillus sp. O23]|uniref:DUF6843 domain-containing protein n=1 Tax=Saccharibacillus sp. O23 TaxID=2009338 RepID=UPI000B4DFE4E|nr:hypothetical protein [Saccharibacillus sp. O23]OWR33043.1 hypothetical protein CDO73_00610 [Saccharibacillus sp. O23]